MFILRNQILIHSNLLSCTVAIKNNNICAALANIRKKVIDLDLKICDWIIATTKAGNTEFDDNSPEMEFLIPIDRQIESFENFIFKPQFKLINAVKIRHEGEINSVKQSEILLKEYIKKHNLEPITGHYYSYIQALEDSPESSIIDIYVGINMNQL